MPRASARLERFKIRTTEESKSLIFQAAALAHQDASEFVRAAAEARAAEVMEQYAVTVVPAEFFDAVYESLSEPAAPVPALARAARLARETLSQQSHA